MVATGIRMTAGELLSLQRVRVRHELIAGELHEMPLRGGQHGLVSAEIAFRLGLFLTQHPQIGGALFAAGTGFWFTRDPDTVRAPDVAYVAEERLAQAIVPGYPELAPDFVVEVVSPGDRASEVQAKVDEWLRAGVRLVWILYPQTRTAMIYRPDGSAQFLHAEDTLTGGPVLPGCSIRLADLF
jgi:Uma2 family endonuclease